MALQLSSPALAEKSASKHGSENGIQLSYFVKKRGGKPSRICMATLLDISNVGLCMEISPEDSELYMESQGKLFLLNKIIDIQIFCRSYPSNVSLEGHVKWIQRKASSSLDEDGNEIFAGVLFRFDNAGERQELAELVSLLNIDIVKCRECGMPISADAALCYGCGSRTVRRRAFLKKIFDSLLVTK